MSSISKAYLYKEFLYLDEEVKLSENDSCYQIGELYVDALEVEQLTLDWKQYVSEEQVLRITSMRGNSYVKQGPGQIYHCTNKDGKQVFSFRSKGNNGKFNPKKISSNAGLLVIEGGDAPDNNQLDIVRFTQEDKIEISNRHLLKITEKDNRVYYIYEKFVSKCKTSDGIDFYLLEKNSGKIKLYEGKKVSFEDVNISMEESQKLAYLQEIAALCKISINDTTGEKEDINDNYPGNDEQNEESNYISLADKFGKINIKDKSALSLYLNGKKALKKSTLAKSYDFLIFPFGCNLSQYEAVKNALNKNISVLEGPPGTGKTQTILNIIANILINNGTVQVVSNNNSAVANVKEKLEKPEVGLNFILAQLGNRKNKEAFINEQPVLPDLHDWIRSDEWKREFECKIKSLTDELMNLFSIERELQKLTIEYEEMLVEYRNFETNVGAIPVSWRVTRRIKDKEKAYKHRNWFLDERIADWRKTIRMYRLRIFKKEHIIPILSRLIFHYSLQEILCQKEEKAKACVGLEDKNTMLCEYSMEYLKALIAEKYQNHVRKSYKDYFTDIVRKSEDFLKDFPVVLSTTFSSNANISSETRYDYLIMDESSQVDICSGAIAMSTASNAVIVGDLKQLPNVIEDEKRSLADTIFNKYEELDSMYNFSCHSFMSSVLGIFGENIKVRLSEHYRCHPLIINFCNKMFYDGELLVMTKGSLLEKVMHIRTTTVTNRTTNHTNLDQADIIKELITEEEGTLHDKEEASIGVIAPFKAQVKELEDTLEGTSATVGTVHKFQGRENDHIYFSTVKFLDQDSDFIDDPKLINVAVSRAKNKFDLVIAIDEKLESKIQGTREAQEANELLRKLRDYINYYVLDGETHYKTESVFSILSPRNYEDLAKLSFKPEQSAAEAAVEGPINELLSQMNRNGKTHITYICYYSLSELIADHSSLTEEEKKYAMNSLTHIDFLFYDNITKRPLLALEIDGSTYHKNGSRQKKRDNMKDSILNKIGIRILRLETKRSTNEPEQIKDNLEKALMSPQSSSSARINL